ncbi:hypothetical protein ACS0TY_028015 [Phlomoides rotata]
MALGSTSRDEKDALLDSGNFRGVDSRRYYPLHVCLIGMISIKKSRNVFGVIDVILKAFRLKGKLTARDWGRGMIIFSFELREDREWVLRNQPWYFDGCLFAIQSLTGLEQPSTLSVSTVSLWARAYDLSLVC